MPHRCSFQSVNGKPALPEFSTGVGSAEAGIVATRKRLRYRVANLKMGREMSTTAGLSKSAYSAVKTNEFRSSGRTKASILRF